MKLRRNEQFKEIFIISEGQLVSQPAAKKNKFIETNTYNTHGTQALNVHTLTYSEMPMAPGTNKGVFIYF